MIENVTDPEQFLYHYTASDTALDYILKSRLLRFGSYGKTNDPKETKTWQFNLGTNGNRDLGAYRMQEESAWLSGKLKRRARVLCFCKDRGPLSGNHLDDIFLRGYCKPRMWAQYACKHSGVCLVFDRASLTKEIGNQVGTSHFVRAGVVQYVDRSVLDGPFENQQFLINIDALEQLGRDAYASLHLRHHHKTLFFEKMTDWRDECEWRWIAIANSDQDLFVAYGRSLVGVMFGEDTPEKIIQDVMDLTKAWGLRYMGLKWKNCSPWYDYENLRY